jgi:hypothetical protein
MKIAIVARKKNCARLLEFLRNTTQGKIEHTGTKYIDGREVAVFIFESTEPEVINTEVWIKSEFLLDDVVSFRFVSDNLIG